MIGKGMNYESQQAIGHSCHKAGKDACYGTVIARFEWVYLVASALLHHCTIQPIGYRSGFGDPAGKSCHVQLLQALQHPPQLHFPLSIQAPAMNHDHNVFPILHFLDIEDLQQDPATRPGRRNPAAEPWRWRQVHEMLAINKGARPANKPLSLPSSRIVYNCSISSARPWKLILQRGKAQICR